jgi:hypothetical protein
MNLILDIDGTLIDRDEDGPIIRPHLGIFLTYAFENFERVSIWTNATPAWYERVKSEIFDEVMPEGKKFDFVWTRENCFLEMTKMGPDGRFYFPITRKPLAHVYAAFHPAYTASNTYIVDDTCETYAFNLLNAVPIDTYNWGELTTTGNCSMNGEDIELLRLISYFEKHLFAPAKDEAVASHCGSQISIQIPFCFSPERPQGPLGQGQLLGQMSPISRADIPVVACTVDEAIELSEQKTEHRARARMNSFGYETATATALDAAFTSQLNMCYSSFDNSPDISEDISDTPSDNFNLIAVDDFKCESQSVISIQGSTDESTEIVPEPKGLIPEAEEFTSNTTIILSEDFAPMREVEGTVFLSRLNR